jgi:ribosome-binding factor A
MPSLRQQKMNQELVKYTGQAIVEIANYQSLITVTHADVSPNFKSAKIFVSVLPESEEHKVLAFLGRHAHDIRNYLKKHLATRTIPFVTFAADLGERNRQRIDELSRELDT